MEGKTKFETPSDLEVVARRWFNAPIDVVWDMWTVPAHLKHWLLGPDGWTMPVCEVDLRAGGRWRYEWEREGGGDRFGSEGEFQEVAPPTRFVYTERMGEGEWLSVNTMEFASVDGGTETTSTMKFASREARDAALATGMNSGVDVSYDRLAEYLTSGPEIGA